MSSIVEYFLAASDAKAAQLGLSGQSASKAGFLTAELRAIDPIVTLATLEEVITGRSAITIIEAGTQAILHDGRNGVWVSRVRDSLLDVLDGTDQPLADSATEYDASTFELRAHGLLPRAA